MTGALGWLFGAIALFTGVLLLAVMTGAGRRRDNLRLAAEPRCELCSSTNVGANATGQRCKDCGFDPSKCRGLEPELERFRSLSNALTELAWVKQPSPADHFFVEDFVVSPSRDPQTRVAQAITHLQDELLDDEHLLALATEDPVDVERLRVYIDLLRNEVKREILSRMASQPVPAKGEA